MSLTYDQRSEIRIAFDEAFVEPERRRAMRVKYTVTAEISEWKKGKEGLPFSVLIEDFSPTGVGLVHESALPVGSQFLIKVPRAKWGDLVVLMTVVRCRQAEEGKFRIGLELSTVMDQQEMGKFVDALNIERRTSSRTKVLLLLLGIVGIGLSVLL